MKQIIYDALTKETTVIDLPDIEMPIIETAEPTLEERLATVETDTDAIVDVLAESLGVTI